MRKSPPKKNAMVKQKIMPPETLHDIAYPQPPSQKRRQGIGAIENDFAYAQMEIGYQPMQQLNWLIQFAGMDLEKLRASSIQFELYKYQITQFAYGWKEPGRKNLLSFISPSKGHVKFDQTRRPVPRLLSPNQISELQQHVRVLLEGCCTQEIPIIEVQNATLSLSVDPPSAEGKKGYPIIQTNIYTAFLLQATLLIGAFAHQIRECAAPDCKVIFAYHTAKKEFCSSTCQVRIGSRRNRAHKRKQQKQKLRRGNNYDKRKNAKRKN